MTILKNSMASALKYFTLPKSKVTIWEKPLKAGGVFYYLYLDQSQIDQNQAQELGILIETTLADSSVKVKKTTKTYQISYSLPNGEKPTLDETMLEMLDDKLASFGYDDTKNQAVGTRGKKMIGTYATTGHSTITVTKPASPDYEVGDLFYHRNEPTKKYKIFSVGANVTYGREKDTVAKHSRRRENFEEKIKSGVWVIEKAQPSQPESTQGSIVPYKVGDFFYKSENPNRKYEITSIEGVPPDVHFKVPNGVNFYRTKEDFDQKINSGDWVIISTQVSQPEIKQLDFYIDYTQKGILLEIELVTDDRIYFTNRKTLDTRIFKKFVTEEKFKLYTPSGGDEWSQFDTQGGTFQTIRVLSADKNRVDFAIYEKGNYETTTSLSVRGFCLKLMNDEFEISQGGGQVTQPKVKEGQYYIDYISNGTLINVTNIQTSVKPEKIYFTRNGVNRYVDTLEEFQKLISNGKYVLYVPSGGDEWKMYTSLSNSFMGYVRILSTSSNEVVLASYDKNGNYENTYTSEIIKFCDELVEYGYIFSQKGGQQLQPTSEPKTEYEKEVKQFEQKKDPNYSEKNKLKKELKDLVELKDLISDIDFEDKVNVSTLIIKTQNKINDIIAKEVEQRIGEAKIFDELFEQSFTPIRNRYDDKMEKNDLVELVAPNGEMSDLNEEVTNLVNSELFTEWFGDFKTAYFYRNLPEFGGIRVSKVLSEKFEPLVVWHGTGKQFSYFRFDNFPAAYFAVNRKYSDFFAKAHSEDGVGYVLPFFIKINNPLDLSFFKNEKVASKDFFDWMYLKTGMTPEQLEINPLMLDSSMPPVPIWVYLRNNPTMLKKLADMGVYDGIKFYEFNPNLDPSDEAYETLAYITFDPHQSKLADPERGQILLASLKSFMLKKGGKL